MLRVRAGVAKVSPYSFLYQKLGSIKLFWRKKILPRFHFFMLFVGLIPMVFSLCACAENQAITKPIVRKPYLLNHHSDSLGSGKIDTLVQAFMKQWSLKGVSIAISVHEKLAYAKGFGFADVATNEEVTPHHLFRIASISKLITATAVMKMIEENKLKLTDKVFGEGGILNEYTQIKDARALQIEVKHLLMHTSGWKNKFRTDPMFIPLEIAEAMKVKPPISLDMITKFMLSQKMMAEAGTFFDYSNFGYCLLGRIIERKTGKNYEGFIKTEVLNPLEINDIQLAKNYLKNKAPLETTYYEHFGAKARPAFDGLEDKISRPYGIDIETLAPAGGWIATPKDLLKFLTHIDGFPQKKDILSLKTIEQMTNQQDSTRTIGWRACNEEIWLRTGSLVGTQAVMARQKNGISWVFVSNTSSWRAHRFSYDITLLMKKIIAKKMALKKENLFDYQ